MYTYRYPRCALKFALLPEIRRSDYLLTPKPPNLTHCIATVATLQILPKATKRCAALFSSKVCRPSFEPSLYSTDVQRNFTVKLSNEINFGMLRHTCKANATRTARVLPGWAPSFASFPPRLLTSFLHGSQASTLKTPVLRNWSPPLGRKGQCCHSCNRTLERATNVEVLGMRSCPERRTSPASQHKKQRGRSNRSTSSRLVGVLLSTTQCLHIAPFQGDQSTRFWRTGTTIISVGLFLVVFSGFALPSNLKSY